jgi:opacity protein-like surface antigen
MEASVPASRVRRQTYHRGFYFGIFAGGGVSDSDQIEASTRVIRLVSPPEIIEVDGAGAARKEGAVMAGVNVGYECRGWELAGPRGWAILPALEFEQFYLGTTQSSDRIFNPSEPGPPDHVFTFDAPLDMAVFMPNLVLTLHTSTRLHPYIGGGVGTAMVPVSGATLYQQSSPFNTGFPNGSEPNLNHFNTHPDAATWAFAYTARAGFRYDLGRNAYFFGEYKFIGIDPTHFTFGSTTPNGGIVTVHNPTQAWNVHFDSLFEHMANAGIGFSF